MKAYSEHGENEDNLNAEWANPEFVEGSDPTDHEDTSEEDNRVGGGGLLSEEGVNHESWNVDWNAAEYGEAAAAPENEVGDNNHGVAEQQNAEASVDTETEEDDDDDEFQDVLSEEEYRQSHLLDQQSDEGEANKSLPTDELASKESGEISEGQSQQQPEEEQEEEQQQERVQQEAEEEQVEAVQEKRFIDESVSSDTESAELRRRSNDGNEILDISNISGDDVVQFESHLVENGNTKSESNKPLEHSEEEHEDEHV